MISGKNNEKTRLLEASSINEQPCTSTRLLLNVDRQKNMMKRSTSSGATSLAGALNNVRRSILKSVGGASLNSPNGSSPKRLPNLPRKTVSFHNLVGSSSVLQFALRSLSPKRQLSTSTSNQAEFHKQSGQSELVEVPSFVITRELLNLFETETIRGRGIPVQMHETRLFIALKFDPCRSGKL
jgi:hypothetical protein